jgi:hypothetical protein
MKELETLLSELRQRLDGKRFGIITGYLQEGYHFAVYDHQGNIEFTVTAATIDACIEAYQNRHQNFKA